MSIPDYLFRLVGIKECCQGLLCTPQELRGVRMASGLFDSQQAAGKPTQKRFNISLA